MPSLLRKAFLGHSVLLSNAKRVASGAFRYASVATKPTLENTVLEDIPTSSCPEGTVLKGINILKDGKDPVALKDSEYPSWLWKTLEPKKTEYTDEEKLSLKYLRHMSKLKVRKNSILE